MGLNIIAVNKKFGYDEEGEGLETNKEYCKDIAIGYFGFKRFRDSLIRFATNGKLATMEELAHPEDGIFKEVWYDSETYIVAMDKTYFDEKDLENNEEKINKYLNLLCNLKLKFPRLHDLFPLIEHCDCEGEIHIEQIKLFLPHLKEFSKSDLPQDYGYGLDFAKSLVRVCEAAIENDGKLSFS